MHLNFFKIWINDCMSQSVHKKMAASNRWSMAELEYLSDFQLGTLNLQKSLSTLVFPCENTLIIFMTVFIDTVTKFIKY